MLAHYYDSLTTTARRNPDRVAMLYNNELRDSLEEALLAALKSVGIEPGETFRADLGSAAAVSRKHRSGHEYSLQEFALSDELIASRFATVYGTYGFENKQSGRYSGP